MAEPRIIQQQREVVLAVQQLADQHAQEEAEAENRLRLDREAADQSFAQAREKPMASFGAPTRCSRLRT